MTFAATENGKKVLTIAECIDREAALREIERRERLMVGDKTISVDALKRFLLNRTAADVAPVVHGQWEPGNPICPVCGENKFKDLDADIWCDWLPPFCPNCGAKMDG